MRAVANGTELFGDVNGIFSCCDCGICTYYACNFGLKPNQIMKAVKGQLLAQGVKPRKEQKYKPDGYIDHKRLPTSRLILRLGVEKYDVPAPLLEAPLKVDMVRIPLKMHIGAPSKAVVEKGAAVVRGQLIADIPEGAMGAKIHASIDGVVTDVTAQYIEIQVNK